MKESSVPTDEDKALAAKFVARASIPADETSNLAATAIQRRARSRWGKAKLVIKQSLVLTLPLPDPPGIYEATVNGIQLQQNTQGQHTLSWKEPLKGRGTTLPAGDCNLYGFPRCSFGTRVGVLPDDDQIELLVELLLAAAAPREHIFFRRDPSGALPVHAILIANNPEALSLVLQLYAAVPSLLMQLHGPGFFVGESGLHVLAANRREEELCDAVLLAQKLLTTPQLIELLCTQTAGGFFRSAPSLFYGGTILGYAASFNLKEAVRAILCLKEVSKTTDLLNAPECACKITGFLPLHAAAANGMSDMFDYLIGREGRLLDDTTSLPEDRRANRNVKTSQGEKMVYSGLSTLQLAAKLGDQRMCKHILRERLSMNWKWGPLTSLSLPLNEIESAYEMDAGLMELVAHFDARPATQAMLLDDFLQGFLHTLFVQKWTRFGQYLFYSLRLVEIVLLALQLVIAFRLKSAPEERYVPLAAATAALAVVLTLLEAWVARLWWINEGDGAGGSMVAKLRVKLRGLIAWLSGFGAGRRVLAYLLTIAGCAMYIQITLSGHADAVGTHDAPLWTLFALGASFQCHAVMTSLCITPRSQSLGVFSITVDRMFANDVALFLVFLSAYLIKYWIAMYISYPRAGTDTLPDIAPFDGPFQSLKALLDAAIYQRRFTTNWDAIDHDAFGTGDWVAMGIFSYFHLMFAITCLILLVRLLMAMMTNTFQGVKRQAQLEWRLLIARNVLRLELVFTAFLPNNQAKFSGAIPPGSTLYVHTFLHVERSTGAPDAVPLLMAQQGGNDLYDVEEQKAAEALKSKREARFKQLRASRKGGRPGSPVRPGSPQPYGVVEALVGEVDPASAERDQLRAMLASADRRSKEVLRQRSAKTPTFSGRAQTAPMADGEEHPNSCMST